jgi:hypothetical protein
VVALGIVAIAVSAVLLSANPGDQESGTVEQPFVGGDLHSLAVDPNNPDRVVVGGHEGGAVSDDGGKTWTQASGIEGANAMGWVIDPRNSSKMYVSGHYGFYRSEDGGKNFGQDNSSLPAKDVHGLGMDPKNPGEPPERVKSITPSLHPIGKLFERLKLSNFDVVTSVASPPEANWQL